MISTQFKTNLKGATFMSTSKNLVQNVQNLGQQVINYLSGAVSRIFGVRDDDYPTTGVQPFEGDIPEKQDF
jgi:hypothetical protein